MNREAYRKAFDAIPFSPDFRDRTTELLRDRLREQEKEEHSMHVGKTKKLAVLIAAAIALLAVSVSAVMLWLSPAQVAERLEDPVLAAAFDSEDAVLLEETAQVGDYTVTLAGLVSGQDLSKAPAEYNGQLVSDRTYAVFTLTCTDGEPLEELPDGLS